MAEQRLSATDLLCVEYSTQVLANAAAGRARDAAMGLVHMIEAVDPEPVNWYVVLVTWAELTICQRLGPDVRPGGVQLAFIDVDGEYEGQEVDVDEVRPAAKWAGRFFAARLAGDDATLQAMTATLDPDLLEECVFEALQMAALACQGQGVFRTWEVR